jgi:uncharacterized damage-inducible protein DinB
MNGSQFSSDRARLRSELEATRQAFHALVESLPADRWRQPSLSSAWSVGEVLVHLTWAIEYLPREVEQACRGKGMFNLPKWLAEPLSYWYVRWLARGAAPDAIRRRYDAAMDATLRSLDAIGEEDWTQGADFYGEGFHTVADLFGEPAKHLAEHITGWSQR